MKQIAVLFLVAATLARAQTWQRVAYDDAGAPGKEPHLVEGTDWRFENPGADEALRTCAFGERVEFAYEGLNPAARYKAKLRFFSDGPREVRVVPGGVTVTLEAGKVVEREVDLPATARLTLALEKVSGPNAVVSDVEILSTDPKPLGVLSEPQLSAPRLTVRPVEGIVSLNGTWSFCTEGLTGADWKPVAVPGEWAMQGFVVNPGAAAGYRRTFEVPPAWSGRRIKLRFDCVHSFCRVFVNDREIGAHEGGMVPFEFDITDAVRPGSNALALAVQSDTLSDRLSCISQYAEHPVGGILRKVQLFAVPAVNIADLKVETRFDKDYRDATLKVNLQIANDGAADARDVRVTVGQKSAVLQIPAGQTVAHTLEIAMPDAPKWDTEHPRLQTLRAELSSGHVAELRYGCRQIEVRGQQVFVNGLPIKLHGVCRHEVHPTLGRALCEPWWRKDAELYRSMNCNFIRTSHYPPAEEFLNACDELGLFVELEAPLCWVGHGASRHYSAVPRSVAVREHLLRANLETVQASFNHPSVIMRSLANESAWQPGFEAVAGAVRALDPTRPTTFHDQCWGGYNNHGSTSMPIANYHYPGFNGSAEADKLARPITFGEYCHLNAYNRFELAADPGVRDAWGRGFRDMWDGMFASRAVLGGSIWAAMDDTFHLPDGRTVGYGTWGPLDGWRRAKPEAWHVRKAYSPVRFDEQHRHLPALTPVELPVLNQSNFSNLREFDIRWTIGAESGTAVADVAPHARGTVKITPKQAPAAGDVLKIEVRDPRGFVADEYAFTFGSPSQRPLASGFAQKLRRDESGGPTGDSFKQLPVVDKSTGQIAGEISGPVLMVLPLNNAGGTQMGGKWSYPPDNRTASAWKLTGVDAGAESVVVSGEYAEAKGTYTYKRTSAGELLVAYRFTLKQNVNPRQVGLVFDLPRAWDRIAWKRNAPYTVYPADHIGRAEGAARAFGNKDKYEPVNFRESPAWPWGEDVTEGGTQDFRATKECILWCQVTDSTGHGVRVVSDGKQHARTWVDGDKVRLLVADYSNAGAEGFFRAQAGREDRPLKAGDVIEGCVQLVMQ